MLECHLQRANIILHANAILTTFDVMYDVAYVVIASILIMLAELFQVAEFKEDRSLI